VLASLFYEKEVSCPVCLSSFQTITIKANKNIPIGKDADFRQIYADVTPYLYDVWVCPSCHYAAPKAIFHTVKHEETLAIAEILSKNRRKLNPLGEREPHDALLCYKLALLCVSFRNVPASTIAGLCLKTAWIYRLTRDPQEKEYLQKAIRYYEEAYAAERFPIAGLTEIRLQYLLGELYRRVRNFPQSIQWFGKVVMSPLASSEPAILKMAREQWGLAKEEYDLVKGASEESASTSEEYSLP
jgi:uncharacterized protein (DUF2225 family)